MKNNKRTYTCGDLTEHNSGEVVILNGWIHRNRNHGGVHFFDIRDRYGTTQAVVDEEAPQECRAIATELKMEYCVAVTGTVRLRPTEMVNKNLSTGKIELSITSLEVLNPCPTLPFMVDGEEETNETLRLRYRWIDLRTAAMRKRLKLRHEATWSVRKHLTEQGFWEVETPTLIKSTPEGARDYLVPSRQNAGRFFALPQSPQLYKQILMSGCVDKYYQIARCYRDEDARGDRQPEFTQIDLEMSFVGREDVLDLMESLMVKVFKEVMDLEIPRPFPRFSWLEAMNSYGVDKPDLRYGMVIQDFTPFVAGSDFGVFKSVLETGGTVKALVAEGAADFCTRKKIAGLEDEAKKKGARGLAWMKVTQDGLDGGVGKFYQNQASDICDGLRAKPGDVIFLMGSEWKTTVEALGTVRNELAKDLGLAAPGEFKFCWVLDYPLFEKNEETGGWAPAHHMFSMPQEQFLDTMEEHPGEVLGDLYDLILNGYELGSGSVRIHDPAIQFRVFDIVGYTKEDAEARFGFLLEALQYGAPPHAGFAVGFDRLVMVMAQVASLREVIAFPKNTQGGSPMDGSPTAVDEEQLAQLHLKVID